MVKKVVSSGVSSSVSSRAPGISRATNARVPSLLAVRAASSPSSDKRIPNAYPSPCAALSLCAVPRHRNAPFLAMAIRRHNASASSVECVVSTIARPSAAADASARHNPRRDSGSIPVDGSSRRTTAGSPTSATATESFRRCPPDRFAASVRSAAAPRNPARDAARDADRAASAGANPRSAP